MTPRWRALINITLLTAACTSGDARDVDANEPDTGEPDTRELTPDDRDAGEPDAGDDGWKLDVTSTLTSDGERVYYSETTDSDGYRVQAWDGVGAPVQLIALYGRPVTMFVHGDHLFVLERVTVAGDERLLRLPLDGGESTSLARADIRAAWAGTHAAYWTVDATSTLWRLASAPSSQAEMVTFSVAEQGAPNATFIAGDDDHVVLCKLEGGVGTYELAPLRADLSPASLTPCADVPMKPLLRDGALYAWDEARGALVHVPIDDPDASFDLAPAEPVLAPVSGPYVADGAVTWSVRDAAAGLCRYLRSVDQPDGEHTELLSVPMSAPLGQSRCRMAPLRGGIVYEVEGHLRFAAR